jgi:hypothetical protein
MPTADPRLTIVGAVALRLLLTAFSLCRQLDQRATIGDCFCQRT